jgi:site-specific recombinase XerD
MDGLEMWSQWMRAAGASEKTVDTRIGGIRSLCAHAGAEDPGALTTMDIINWLAACRSPWTRKTYATSARAWHQWLVEQGLRDDDPTERVPRPPQPKGIPRPAGSTALSAVLEVAPRRARAYIALAAFEGLRVHEIAKVQGEHFQGEWLYVTGKGGQLSALPVHQVVQQLQRGFPDEGWWFPSGSRLGHVTPNSVSRTVSQAFRRCGYAVTAHQLRHWFGTHTLRGSRDLRVTQELMRHQSLSSTQIYTEVANRAKVEAVRRLAAS